MDIFFFKISGFGCFLSLFQLETYFYNVGGALILIFLHKYVALNFYGHGHDFPDGHVSVHLKHIKIDFEETNSKLGLYRSLRWI